MHEGDLQTVLRCGQCNKPFDKQSTLKRHGYYCRSRRLTSIPRSRSCISCVKLKARCDNKQPECSRCISKAAGCHYPANTLNGIGPRISYDNAAPTEQRRTASLLVPDSRSVENRHEASNHSDMVLNSTPVTSEPEFAAIGGDILAWDDPDIDFTGFLNLQTDGTTVPYPSFESAFIFHPSTLTINPTVQIEHADSSLNTSIPPVPTSNLRSLVQRPSMPTGPQRIANLTLHTLKSYPQMMLHHNTLPPFIHPCLISSNVDNHHMESLTNCISLVRMISSGIGGSRKLFWKNVRQECERMYEEHLKLNRWELLAAMQALSIYILIRLDEGETDHNDFDFLILAAITVIAKQLARIPVKYDTPSTPCNHDPKISWKDWIYEESRRRLAVVYRVMNMLVYFEPAAMCELQKDLVLAPLPAKKQSWEAGDELLWKAETEREPGLQTEFGLAATGELVRLDEGQLYCGGSVLLYKSMHMRTSPKTSSNWEEWCSGMDGFGGLIMLAASLIV